MAGFNITIAGDSAINLEFAKTISPQTSGMIRVAAQTLTDDPIPGVTELVPTFCSLMVTYDPCVIGYDELCQRVQGKLRNLAAAEAGVKRIVVIPVCYGGEFGPDLPTTGIYPLASPGGWQIIGRSPVRPYDPERAQPILYRAGEYLRFQPITQKQYDAIEAQIAAGGYECDVIVEEV